MPAPANTVSIRPAASPPALRGVAELRAYLHSYRIRTPDNLSLTARASIIISAIDRNSPTIMVRRAARELAARDPEEFSWLPDWKPRVAVKGGG